MLFELSTQTEILATIKASSCAKCRHVSGTCRDDEACENFRAEGVDAHVLDSDNEQILRCIDACKRCATGGAAAVADMRCLP